LEQSVPERSIMPNMRESLLYNALYLHNQPSIQNISPYWVKQWTRCHRTSICQ